MPRRPKLGEKPNATFSGNESAPTMEPSDRGGRHLWLDTRLRTTGRRTEGMPVYRQKKTSFFQKPFSNTYQRIWNRAKGNAEGPVSSATTTQHATNAEYAVDDQATVIAVDGQPFPSSKLPRRSSPTLALDASFTPREKPTQQVQNKIAQTADKIVHVKDVNEGTPAVGTEYTVDADEALIKSLAGGEQILSVKEKVIGIYRDGKLVPVEQTAPAATATVAPTPAKPVRKEVDPWFGDTVTAPTEEVSGSPAEPAAPAELAPPSRNPPFRLSRRRGHRADQLHRPQRRRSHPSRAEPVGTQASGRSGH